MVQTVVLDDTFGVAVLDEDEDVEITHLGDLDRLPQHCPGPLALQVRTLVLVGYEGEATRDEHFL